MRDYKEEYCLTDDEKSQVIAFLNAECSALNQFGCFIYNKHNTWKLDEKNRQAPQFEVGDKIICTKNADVPVIVPEDENCDKKEGNGLWADSDDLLAEPTLKYTGASDGKFEEDFNLKMKMVNERLMNGNLYKIRAFVTNNVKHSGNAEDAVENMDNKSNSDGKDDIAASEGAVVTMKYCVLDDLAGEIVRVNLNHLQIFSDVWRLSNEHFLEIG